MISWCMEYAHPTEPHWLGQGKNVSKRGKVILHVSTECLYSHNKLNI